MDVVYFSTKSGNTERFVNKLEGFKTVKKIPLTGETIRQDRPYVLIVPTYGSGDYSKSVPPQVIRFLNIKENRDSMVGVVSMGNRNFGVSYGIAGDMISQKCNVPFLGTVEVFGTSEDVEEITQKIQELEQ